MNHIAIAETDEDVERCFAALNELRPHLSADTFIAQVKRQREKYGYRLVYLEDEEDIRSVAGFRISESLAWGVHMYVDDLVTRSGQRSKGCGEKLFKWLVDFAKTNGCTQLHLDSGVQRFDAHRFYMKVRMDMSSHHFSIRLT